MKRYKEMRYSAVFIAVVLMLTALMVPPNVGVVHPVSAGKYGDIVPTEFELQLLNKINENRTLNGAQPLKFNASLWWVARAHSQDMIDYDFFDHTSSEEGQFNGASFFDRVEQYAEYEYSYVGECIACSGWGIDAEWCMSAWKNSPPHWDIIINPNFSEIGLGLLEGEFSGSPHAGLYTADFGKAPLSIDLALDTSDIGFHPSSPSEGEVVNITVSINNLGSTDAYPVSVEFYDGDPDTGGVQIGTRQDIPHILIHGESTTVSVDWDTQGEIGSHDIYVIVDRGDVIPETDEGNNMAFRTLVVNTTSPGIPLEHGWNLVSFPHITSDTSLGFVLDSIDGKYDAVQYYDSSDSEDPWKHYHASKPQEFIDLQNLDNKMGFWIRITDINGAVLEVDGNEPTSNQHITLNKGWNLVSYPSAESRMRDVALNNLEFSDHVDAIQYYDKSTEMFKDLDENDLMEPGNGYWVHATCTYQWIVEN